MEEIRFDLAIDGSLPVGILAECQKVEKLLPDMDCL